MNQTEKLNKILDCEKINLKQFSDLTGINYDSMLRYRNNRSPISIKQISKICSAPRFAKYRELLLSVDMPIEDTFMGVDHVKAPSPEAHKARELLEKLEKAGRLEEATEIMETLVKRAEKQ